MSLFDGDDVEAEAATPTWTEKTQQLIAKQQLADFQTYFKRTEDQLMGGGDPGSGTAAQSTSLGSILVGNADVQQSVFKARNKAGPPMVNRGTFSKNETAYNTTAGSGVAGVVSQSEADAEADINQRLISGLGAGMGLGAGVSRSSTQAAGQAAQRGISIAQAELENNISGMQGKAQMITDGLGMV